MVGVEAELFSVKGWKGLVLSIVTVKDMIRRERSVPLQSLAEGNAQKKRELMPPLVDSVSPSSYAAFFSEVDADDLAGFCLATRLLRLPSGIQVSISM